jgi:ABC-2 type transport system permease protein
MHVVIALAAGYAVGSEFRRRSLRAWLACAGGNPLIALVGKLAPLLFIFTILMFTVPFILEGWFQIPFKGDVAMVIAAAILMIIGYLALGALVQLLAGDLATGLGLTGLIVSPAFGYAGVGFPTLGMNAFAQAWSTFLPVRWYMAVLFGQAARGLPVHQSAPAFAMLAPLAVCFTVLALLRLRAIAKRPTRKADIPAAAAVPAGMGQAFAVEWRRVLGNRGAFALLVLAPLIYGAYYPQPYLTQILRKVPIVVVDNDQSELSRALVETLDASGAVSVAARATTLPEAQEVIGRGEALAAVGIPSGTERDVLKGLKAHIPIYADATYLFIFRSTASGIAIAINAQSSELALAGARADGSLARSTLAGTSPAAVLLQPIFNPVGGYANYIVPAAFVLILQQTLLIGAAVLTVGMPVRGSTVTRVLGRGVAHLTLYAPTLALYFIVLPRVYGFSTLGSPLQVMLLASLLILATSFMGQMAGAWFKHPETPTLVFLATSLPQFFLTGFSWPREAIPAPILTAGRIFPADLAIDGIVRINQLGAHLWEVAHDWAGLWLLTVVYFTLAVVSTYALRRRHVHG